MTKTKTPKLSFKRDKKQTGLAGVGYPHQGSTIKMDGMDIGSIVPPTWNTRTNSFRIQIRRYANEVELTENPNCPWVNKFLTGHYDTDEKAREWIKANWDKLLDAVDFYPVEPDDE